MVKDKQKSEKENYYDDWIQVKGQRQKNYNRKGRKNTKRTAH